MHPLTTRARFLLAAVAAISLLMGARAFAKVEGAATLPETPTVCDSVQLIARGFLPNSCYHLRGFRVGAPEPLPTMGPIPTYRIRGVIRAEGPNPYIDIACTAADQPYRVAEELGKLPFGRYNVEIAEYIYPFPADSTTPIDSSRVFATFSVSADTCRTANQCVLLGFAKSAPEPARVDGCTARVMPGGRACFDVTLMNDSPVAALQTVVALPRDEEFAYDFANLIVPVEVSTTSRAEGLQVAWTRDGTRTKIVVYSTSGAVIQPGTGPILHLCYDVKVGISDGAYIINFGPTLVSSPEEEILPLCPTFARVTGLLCVGESACDLNGDGVSDVRDIVRMVGCILSPPTCPDSVRSHYDCNGDSSVDVRDIVCCVRRVLTNSGAWSWDLGPIGAPSTDVARVGFEGEATWENPLRGRAVIAIDRGRLFGGVQFMLDSHGLARVKGIALENPQGLDALQWEVGSDGRARVMVYDRNFSESGSGAAARAADLAAAVAPIRLILTLGPASDAANDGGVEIRNLRGATSQGATLSIESGALELAVTPGSVSAAPSILAARPNPFVDDTEISFALPTAARASVRLFDVRGRLVRTLQEGTASPGLHRIRWDGRDDRGRNAGVGIYFVRFTAGSIVRTERILRLR